MSSLTSRDITVIAACSTVLAGIMTLAVLLAWLRDGRPVERSWQFAPFGLAVPAGVLLTWPDLLGEQWGLRLGWFSLTLVYGAVWQAARVTAGLPASPWRMALPCLMVLLLSATLFADDGWPQWRMLPRVLLFAAFNALAAREFLRMRDPQVPSAATLAWVCAGFAAWELLRSPFALTMPAPLGPGEPQVWTIGLFNFAIVLEGLLLGVFLTAVAREQLAARHWRMALADPLTGIGNRRGLDERMAQIARSEASAGRYRAVAILDIDLFKAINDKFGHAFGDVVIAGTAELAGAVLGRGDVFRTGGEEFAALVEADTAEALVARVEALRRACATRIHVAGELSCSCTLSIGMAPLDGPAGRGRAFQAADAALYEAKRRGRNRTVLAQTDGGFVDIASSPVTAIAGKSRHSAAA